MDENTWHEKIFEIAENVGKTNTQIEFLSKEVGFVAKKIDKINEANAHINERVKQLELKTAIHAKQIDNVHTKIKHLQDNQEACKPVIGFLKSPRWAQLLVVVGLLALLISDSRHLIVEVIKGFKIF